MSRTPEQIWNPETQVYYHVIIDCKVCHGRGQVDVPTPHNRRGRAACPHCVGTGRMWADTHKPATLLDLKAQAAQRAADLARSFSNVANYE